MRFAKSIFCGDMKIEVTANTKTEIDIVEDGYGWEKKIEKRLDEFDIDEFIRLYEHIPEIAAIIPEIKSVTEVMVQVDFWDQFCDVLNKSADIGFRGQPRGSMCLTEACRGVLSTDSGEYKLKFDKSERSNCVKIHKIGGWFNGKRLEYPLDYLRLLKSVEDYIDKILGQQKETKARSNDLLIKWSEKNIYYKKMTSYNLLIKKFLKSHKEEIDQFKEYAINCENIEGLRERARPIYYNLLREGALIVDGKGFSERYCGFDIYKKKDEIDAVIKKLNDSIDVGEDKVDYAIKWLGAESSVPFKNIKKNCESKYRYGCIILKNSSFINEVQEYDHILVSEAGVILIETKHWKGCVKVQPDGKWVRDPKNDGHIVGIESPMYQIQRHEALIKSILPNVPIHSLLVFSNSSLILEGAENCKMCRVIYVDKLKETVMHIFSMTKPISINIVNHCVDEIERHKVHIMQDDIRELE